MSREDLKHVCRLLLALIGNHEKHIVKSDLVESLIAVKKIADCGADARYFHPKNKICEKCGKELYWWQANVGWYHVETESVHCAKQYITLAEHIAQGGDAEEFKASALANLDKLEFYNTVFPTHFWEPVHYAPEFSSPPSNYRLPLINGKLPEVPFKDQKIKGINPTDYQTPPDTSESPRYAGVRAAKKATTSFTVGEEQQPEPKLEMWLEVRGGALCIVTDAGVIGYIFGDGRCSILNEEDYVDAYNKWRKYDMHVREQEPVEWRGRHYIISVDCVLFSEPDTDDTEIYDFNACEYLNHCQDDNIIRFKHNNRPIGF